MSGDQYEIDADVSRFTVQAFAAGLLSKLGHSPTLAVRDFKGQARFNPDRPKEASLVIRVKADSLQLTDRVSDKDRRELESTMKEQVLETAKYPDVVFESIEASATGSGPYSVNVTGNLTVHGVTNRERIAVQAVLIGDMLRANGQFTLSQNAYRIKPVSVAGGALKLKDKLKCSFDIVARKKAQNSEREPNVLSHSGENH